jgi:hypothetical protein
MKDIMHHMLSITYENSYFKAVSFVYVTSVKRQRKAAELMNVTHVIFQAS